MKELLEKTTQNGRAQPEGGAAKKPARARRGRRMIALCIAAALLLAVLAGVNIFAALNETTAVHIDPAAIEMSTLAIGSHLIHLSALTDATYQAAQSSIQRSGQERVYYKSELADGAWFDITTATSLKDITSAGTPVANSVIAALFFTHHTRSDGVTYDLLTGLPVNPFDTPNPYDLRAMEELMPLDLQHKLLEETQKDSDQGQKKLARLDSFWATQVRNAATGEADVTLGHLQAYYQHLSANDGTAREMDAVQNVMASVDALRRYEVMNILDAALQLLSKDLSSFTDPAPVESGEEDPGDPAPVDVTLASAANESLNNVAASKAEHAGRMMAQGTTLTSRLRYSYCTGLITSAAAGDYAACNGHLRNIIALENIMGDVVEDAGAEAAIMMDSLLPPAMDQYATALRQGENARYAEQQAAGEPAAVLGGIVTEATNQLNGYRAELQYLIDAYCVRLSNDEALDYIAGLLIEGTGLYAVIPADAFSDGARLSVDAYLEYLGAKQRELDLAGGGGPMDGLQDELDSLEQQRLGALDQNDLERAAELEAEMARLRAELDDLLAQLAAQLNALNRQLVDLNALLEDAIGAARRALEDEIAALKAQIDALAKSAPEGSLLELLQRLKNECKAIINNTAATSADLDALNTNLDTIIGMMDMEPVAVYAALQELLASLELGKEIRGDNALDEAIRKVTDALLDGQDAYFGALATGITTDTFEAICEAFFAGELDGPAGSSLSSGSSLPALTAEEQEVVILLAAHMVARQDADAMMAEYLAIRAQRAVLANNPLVFEVPRSAMEQYVPALAVARLGGMRYVWSGNSNRVTLSRGASYYIFKGYTNEVERSEAQGGTVNMAHPAVVQNGLFLPVAFTAGEFGVDSVYFAATGEGARCGVATTELLVDTAELLYAAVMA